MQHIRHRQERWQLYRYNAYVHCTSSPTLALMQHDPTPKLQSVMELLDNGRAPVTGDFSGFHFSLHADPLIGAPAFGTLRESNTYHLATLFSRYTNNNWLDEKIILSSFSFHLNLVIQKLDFRGFNLFIIRYVQIQQLGINLSKIQGLERVNPYLDAAINFYYLQLCVHKYLFLNPQKITQFIKDHKFDGQYVLYDYLLEYFSIKNLLENPLNIKEIYESPTLENIAKLLEWTTIQKNVRYKIPRYEGGTHDFKITTQPISFFDTHNNDPHQSSTDDHTNFNLDSEAFYRAADDYVKKQSLHFTKVHQQAENAIQALEKHKALWMHFSGPDYSPILVDTQDPLIAAPFPVIFIVEGSALTQYGGNEYRSDQSLELGRHIFLIATDKTENKEKIHDWLVNQNVGPVEVVLREDLDHLHLFDPLLSDALIQAFQVVKRGPDAKHWGKIYRALTKINEYYYTCSRRFVMQQHTENPSSKLEWLLDTLQSMLLRKKQLNDPYKLRRLLHAVRSMPLIKSDNIDYPALKKPLLSYLQARKSIKIFCLTMIMFAYYGIYKRCNKIMNPRAIVVILGMLFYPIWCLFLKTCQNFADQCYPDKEKKITKLICETVRSIDLAHQAQQQDNVHIARAMHEMPAHSLLGNSGQARLGKKDS
jgi:hypothetical protein